LKLARQARVNAQMLSVNHKGIRDLSHEDALKVRGEIDEAIRRLQEFRKDLAKKLDTPGRRPDPLLPKSPKGEGDRANARRRARSGAHR